MTYKSRGLNLLLAGVLISSLAGVAGAQIIIDPSPGNSITPPLIRLVGRDAFGVADPSGVFTVIVRDLANNPVANAAIRVEFQQCVGVSICPTQGPSVTAVGCILPDPWVEGISAADGSWSASIVGCARGVPQTCLSNGAHIYADGVLLARVPVSIVDLSGCNGVGANDLAVWLEDFISELNPERSDYDGSGGLGANDLSLWLIAFGTGQSALNCQASVCP